MGRIGRPTARRLTEICTDYSEEIYNLYSNSSSEQQHRKRFKGTIMFSSRLPIRGRILSLQAIRRLSPNIKNDERCSLLSAVWTASAERNFTSILDKPLVPGVGLGKTSTGLVSSECRSVVLFLFIPLRPIAVVLL